METRCGIYMITNLLNGRSYVGQSVTVEFRWKDHLKGTSLSPIARALKRYGASNFLFEVLEECDRLKLNEREAHYVKAYGTLHPNGYNLREGGLQSAGFSDLSRLRLSRTQRQVAQRPGQRERQVAANTLAWSDPELRKAQSERAKELWSDPKFQAKVEAADTPAIRKRKSNGAKRLWQNPEHREKMLKVLAANNDRSRR